MVKKKTMRKRYTYYYGHEYINEFETQSNQDNKKVNELHNKKLMHNIDGKEIKEVTDVADKK